MGDKWNLDKLLDMSNGYWKGCALQAAVRLDFFTHIGSGQRNSEEVATMSKADVRATEMLLDALVGMELLTKHDFRYANTPFSSSYLNKAEESYMGHIILHHHHILDGWAQLDTAVTTGKPVEKRSYGEEIERQSFLMGMYNLGMISAPHIAGHLDLRGKKNLLDLGGGPGTYAIHFCLANPELRATIFDKPTTRSFAEQTVAAFGLEDRITFEAGDFTTDTSENGPYDVAWLSHILHSNGMETCFDIIEKTAKIIRPGGILFIHDFILDNDKTSPEFAALFSLNMLVNNPNGRSYADNEIRTMLKAAGIYAIERHSYLGPNSSSILFGVA